MDADLRGLLAIIVTSLVCTAIGIVIGRLWPNSQPQEPIIEVRIDTVTVTQVRIDTVERVRTVTAWLPVAAPDPDDHEPMDTIDYPYTNPTDSVMVTIPISRYVAEQDSLYRVVAEGYAVDFKEITVYPKTVTITNTVEVVKPSRWGLGIQAGYGATLQNNTVKLAPYLGVGISYNIITW